MGIEKRILVIDDEKEVCQSFKVALKETGLRVKTLTSAREGLSEVKKGYDLVFLDSKMPSMSGIEVFKKMRAKCPDLPIYIVIELHRELLIELEEIRQLGLEFQLLRKPVRSVELQTLVLRVLEHSTSS